VDVGRDACGRVLRQVLPSDGDASREIARTRSPSARHAAASPHRAALPATSSDHDCLPHRGQRDPAPAPRVPARPVTSIRAMPSPALTVTVSPGTSGRLCHRPLPDSPLPGSAASAPHGCPGPVTPAVNARTTRARSARPATVTPTWTAASAISAPPSRRPSPRNQPGSRGGHGGCTPGSAARVKPEHAASAARPWPSVGKPTVCTDRPHSPDAVRYTSVDTATRRLTVTRRDTGRDKKETAPGTRFRSQGPFPLVVAGVGFEPT